MTSPDTHAVGFIGLGAMGRPMAKHLAEKLPPTCQLRIYDVVESAMDDLVAKYPQRVIKGTSPKDVVLESDIIISMVPEGSHVRAVYLDETTGVCAANHLAQRILIDCSTIDAATSIAVQDQIRLKHPAASFYDAPVSGGVIGAEKGTIAFFVGCPSTDSKLKSHLMPVLSLMGTSIIPCGGPSLGLTAKLCNNYLSGLIAIASVDAMKLAMANGLDPRTFSRVVAAGTGQNTICDKFNPVPGVVPGAPSSHGYQNGFKVQLMRKDFGLAVEMAQQSDVDLVLGEAGLRTYDAASKDPRCRDLDSRVVFRYLGGDEDWQARIDEQKND